MGLLKRSLSLVGSVLAFGCVHQQVAGGDLDRVVKPAFVSRIEEGAGPKALVFREDRVYGGKLRKMEPREADRRLQVKLTQVSRFAISDRFRASTLAQLPQDRPWTDAVDPALVGRQLESFLVEEVPANPPDYDLLKPLGADSVIEFVVEDYGLRSKDGQVSAYVRGFGRMFFLDGGEVWRRTFDQSTVRDGRDPLDPFKVAKDPELFRTELEALIDEATARFAKDLSPRSRRGLPPGSDELNAPSDSTNKSDTEAEPKKTTPVKPKNEEPATGAPAAEDQPPPVDAKPMPPTKTP